MQSNERFRARVVPWALGLTVLLTCGRSAEVAPPKGPISVLLVTIDTLRPDALGWVSGRGSTPEIDRLAEASFRFPAAVSPTPLTLPAHASILTGLDPPRHGVRDNGQVLGDAGPATLAERLRAAGYATAAFVSGFPLRRYFGLDRGFDHYDDTLPAAGGGVGERSAAATTTAALAWLAGVEARSPGSPWLLWVHYYDPHAPYASPEGAAPDDATAEDAREAYLGEVAAVDAALGDLLAGVASLRAERPRLTVVTADHGESLGEHGEDEHGFFVYDSTLLVPALWHLPGRISPGESDAPARLVDVAPTVLELVGQPAIAEVDGVSLRPTLDGEAQEVPPAYVETLQPWLGFGWSPLVGLRTAEAKLIVAPRPELYDLAGDPGETEDRHAADPATATRLGRLLRERQSRPPAAAAPVAPSSEAIAALRSLGYAGGVALAGGELPDGLADPKDRLRQKKLLGIAEEALAAGGADEALATLEVVLAGEPDNRYALLRLGQILVERGELASAVPPLERLLVLDPEQPEARFALADALSRGGQAGRAIEQWRELVARQPRRAAAWSNLGALLVKVGQLGEAGRAFGRALELEPANATFRVNLAACRLQIAVVAAGRGDANRARAELDAALALEPGLAKEASRYVALAPLVAERPPAGTP